MIRKISIKRHSKARPNSKTYTLSLPIEVIRELEISKDDREVEIRIENKKVVISKHEI